jgi:hypothetical protein
MVFLGRKSNTLRLGAFAGENPNSRRVISRKERGSTRLTTLSGKVEG